MDEWVRSYRHPYILADTKIFGGYATFSAKRNTVHTYALPFGGPSPLYSGAFPLKCCRRRADLRVLFVQRQGKGGEEFLQEAVGGGQAHGPDRRLGGGAGGGKFAVPLAQLLHTFDQGRQLVRRLDDPFFLRPFVPGRSRGA